MTSRVTGVPTFVFAMYIDFWAAYLISILPVNTSLIKENKLSISHNSIKLARKLKNLGIRLRFLLSKLVARERKNLDVVAVGFLYPPQISVVSIR